MTIYSRADLGWRHHFALQCGEITEPDAARLTGIDRDRVSALSPDGPLVLTCPQGLSTGELAVGDWTLFDPDSHRIIRRLEPFSAIKRKAAGREARTQLIAANVDTLGIVTSCNSDFNEARLERYLALASSAGCMPLILLTKADMAEDPDEYRHRATALSPLAVAETLDATDPGELSRLSGWVGTGQTMALVGSSGVGKTTITNGLTGASDLTQDIREDDARGRHTTTARFLKRTVSGGWLIDTPGMRELGLADASDGIAEVFGDIEDLAAACRFNDCSHESEPGCAVKAAIDSGELDPERLKRWDKLKREDRYNSESIAETRARARSLNKLYRGGSARAKEKRRIE
ncbi:ribosome small subunit-dependent GTPase A [Pelagovum pacificum]|uniref:Small ribosomal subunit biogenesis GTPase RsgA n=1 Tax=Pelagovum pacificum TaxID=2588711 RepID=A0A5C5GC77_9RHOB|nr:ribosome small subunit-dependent GTPase A [Pelagovum pacificum]QQA42500.1 ribosome small subunit-dependent GTPase A [Pelagovum pacificum]TNY31584.1 ribosome small subunit-dependent GTPase A [Pelagovum pacificum]